MGFNLGQLLRGVGAQINPFDHGQTFATVMRNQPPKQAPSPASTARPQQRQQPLVPRGPVTGVDVAKEAVGGILRQMVNGVTNAPVHLALEGADILNNIHPGDSTSHAPITYHPQSPLERAVFGSAPIKSWQGQAADASKQGQQFLQQHGIHVDPTIASAASIPIAGALAAMDLGNVKPSLQVAKGGVDVARHVVEAAVQGARNFDAALGRAGHVALPAGGVRPDVIPEVTQPKPSAELPTYGTKSVSTLDKAFRSTRSIIERQGEPGQQLGGMLQGARDQAELSLAKLQKQLPTVRALKGKDFENFVEATQGRAQPKSPKVQQAINEWQAVHPSIREAAVNAGLDVGDLGPNYYPHFIDYEQVFKNKDTYNEAINHLVKTGQAQTPEDAIKLLGYARDVSRNRQFGNLEASRLVDLPTYDKTPNSLVSYLSGSTHRIAQASTFGPKDETALQLIAKAGQQGFDTEAMKNAYDVAVGAKQYNPSLAKFSRGVRSYNSTTRLGLGAITNASQNVNTGIVTGHLRTLGAMIQQFSPKVREYVGDTGVISDAVLNDLREQAGYIGKGLSKITAPGFNAVEKFNRSVSATAGRDYALRLAQKGDEKTLRRLGVTGEVSGKTLTHDQQVQASRKVVEKTQFKVDPQDLPGWADSPGGKLVAQFRTFSYSQGKFFSNEIIKPAAKGNLKPLARLLAALPVGYGLYELKRNIAGRPEEENKGRLGLEAFGNVGGAGLAMDLFRGLVPLNGKYLSPDRFTSMAAGTLGGPAVGNAVDFLGAASQGVQTKNLPKDGDLSGKAAIQTGNGYLDETQLARFGLRQIPIVGTAIQNRVLPYKAATDTKTGLTPKQQAMEDDIAKSEAAIKLAEANGTRPKDGARPKTGSRTLDASNKRVETTAATFASGLDQKSKDVLTRYAKLNTSGKAAFKRNPKNVLELKQAQYQQDHLSGKLTGPKDYAEQQSLSREQITSNYSQDVLDFYNLSKADMNAYFKQDPQKAKQLYDQARQLDGQLTQQLGSTTKFKYGLGTKPKKARATRTHKVGTVKSTSKGGFNYAKLTAAKASSTDTGALRKLVGAPKFTRKAVKAAKAPSGKLKKIKASKIA